MSRAERLAMIEREHPELPLSVQAKLLGVSRSSLYYQPEEPSPEEVAIGRRIDELYTRHPYYGSRRIAVCLSLEGMNVNRKAAQRHMREMGIAGIAPGPNTSKRRLDHQVYPYLLRGVASAYPDHVWGVDITYIRLRAGWMYLSAILDWYSRYVVEWELDQSLELGFVLEAMQRALAGSAPEICNSDQGSWFTSPGYVSLLERAGVRISMDGKGRASDNVYTERLWRTVKYEEVYIKGYETPRDTRRQGKRDRGWSDTWSTTTGSAPIRRSGIGHRQRSTWTTDG